MDYVQMIEYVDRTLVESGNDRSRKHPFRSRSKHSKRVLTWAVRLCEGREDVDREVLYTATIFHDVGYAVGLPEAHQVQSAAIFREYAAKHNMSADFIEKVANCISIHSNKDRMQTPEELTIEQLLLMEADLLDEEGAMAICWDGMACGLKNVDSYEEAVEHTRGHFDRNYNPMVTATAKKYWEEKQNFVDRYLEYMDRNLAEAGEDILGAK